MRAQQLLAQAAEAYRRRDFAAAAGHCRALLERHPADADAMHLFGLVERQRGDKESAERLLRASIAGRPQHAEYRINLSNLLRADGRLREAEAELRHAIALEPHSRKAQLALLRVLNDGGAASAAVAQARLLIERDARDAEAWLGLATAERKLGQSDAAASSYERALEIRPDYAVARHNYASLLCERQEAERALEELDYAEKLGAGGAELAYNRGSALFTLARFTEADAALREALRQRPLYIEAHTLLAKLLYMQGDPAFADELYAAARRSQDLGLGVALGEVLLRCGRLAEADEVTAALLEANPRRLELAANRAAVLQERGNLSDARRHAEAAHAALPGSSDIAATLVAILLQLDAADAALPIIAEQRRRNPHDQGWIAYAATASRLLGTGDYPNLYDYERFVGIFDLPAPPGYASMAAFNSELADYLGGQHRLRAQPLDQSLRNGTQTVRDLCRSQAPVMRAFFGAADDALREYRAALGTDASHPFLSRNAGPHAFAGAWSVQLREDGHHVNHVHPKGWISSVYYVEVPSAVAGHPLKAGWLKFGEPRRTTPRAGPDRYVEPRAGRLVLFPSYVWHGTVPLCGAEPRLTIAFDAVPSPRDRQSPPTTPRSAFSV